MCLSRSQPAPYRSAPRSEHMNAVPPMLAGKRRVLAVLLLALTLGEGVLAMLFSAALDRLVFGDDAMLIQLLAAGGIAAMGGAALLVQAWVIEDFAQDYATDYRKAPVTRIASRPALADPDTSRGECPL